GDRAGRGWRGTHGRRSRPWPSCDPLVSVARTLRRIGGAGQSEGRESNQRLASALPGEKRLSFGGSSTPALRGQRRARERKGERILDGAVELSPGSSRAAIANRPGLSSVAWPPGHIERPQLRTCSVEDI